MAVAVRLLIIDDEPDSIESIKLLVESRGYMVRTASSAAEARRAFQTWHPAIVLMDLMLPDADGLELLREFKTERPESQVIMVTGYGSVPKAVEAMRSGAFTFLEKPVAPDLLRAVLDMAGERLELPAEDSTFTIPPDHTLAEIEKLAILQTLERTSWNKRKAAHILGVYRPTLYSKLRKYQLTDGRNGSGRGIAHNPKLAGDAPPARQNEPSSPR